MSFEITMPQLGLTMERGSIVEWLVGEGDEISAGQEIFLVETDKAIVAVEAHQEGILAHILVPAGQEVLVGTPVAVGVASGERQPAGWQPTQATATSPLPGPASRELPAAAQTFVEGPPNASWKARTVAREAGLDLAALVGSGPDGRIVAADVGAALARQAACAEGVAIATPVAANLAEALGLDLAQVSGSGPGGRIGQADVLAAAAALIRQKAPTLPAREAGPPGVESITPLKGLRKIVSNRMASSAHTTARVTLFREADAGELVRLRERSISQGLRVSYNDLLIHICAVALREHPDANARLGAGGIEHLDRINVGLAVDTERGLLVPVVHDADRLTIPQIAAETDRLVATARNGRIPPDALSGGTFTLTNLGMLGVEGFTPIINLPECCILGVGKIVRKPVVIDEADTVAVRPTMSLSLVFDHRVIDGAPAARFLDRIAHLVEDPVLLLTRKT